MSRIDTAYHEAGHLVAKMFFRLHPIKATIIREGIEGGSVTSPYEDQFQYEFDEIKQKTFARKSLISSFTGYAAEKKYDPNTTTAGSINDFLEASDRAGSILMLPKKFQQPFTGQGYYDYVLHRFIPLAEKFVNRHWGEITYVAELLIKNKTLWENDIDELYPILREKFPTFR